MKIRDSLASASIVSLVLALSSCASVPEVDIARRTDEVRVYKWSELSGIPYESVGHIWVDSWRSAFFLPTYPDRDEAVRALRVEAALRGANGVVNLVCLDENVRKKDAAPAMLCYANAIRVRSS